MSSYNYAPIKEVEIKLNWYYHNGGQAGKTFKSIEDVAQFFKDEPEFRKNFTKAGQKEKEDRGENLDKNF